jgi:hypothetical protein
MDKILVLKQDQAEAFPILSNNIDSLIQQVHYKFPLSLIAMDLRGGCFGGLVATTTKTGFG